MLAQFGRAVPIVAYTAAVPAARRRSLCAVRICSGFMAAFIGLQKALALIRYLCRN